MRKIKTAAVMALLTIGLSSCVVYQSHTVTGNPIGTKVGIAKGRDITMKTAAKKGKITKIGSVDITMKSYVVWFTRKTVVTGE